MIENKNINIHRYIYLAIRREALGIGGKKEARARILIVIN